MTTLHRTRLMQTGRGPFHRMGSKKGLTWVTTLDASRIVWRVPRRRRSFCQVIWPPCCDPIAVPRAWQPKGA